MFFINSYLHIIYDFGLVMGRNLGLGMKRDLGIGPEIGAMSALESGKMTWNGAEEGAWDEPGDRIGNIVVDGVWKGLRMKLNIRHLKNV